MNWIPIVKPRLGLKNVAIVGSSGSLRGSGFGEKIDSYDKVIRFNRAPVEGYEKDVGSRTDLRVVNCHVFEGQKINKKFEHQPRDFVKKLKDTKILVIYPKYIEDSSPFIDDSCKLYLVKYSESISLGEKYGLSSMPSIGAAMILLCVEAGLKPTLFGFDLDPKDKSRTHYWERRAKSSFFHNVSAEKKLFSKLLSQGKVIMPKEDTKLKEHWNKIPASWRHVASHVPEDKKQRIYRNWNDLIKANLPWDEVKNVVDWGCGGGLLSKVMVDEGKNVLSVDVSEKSLKACELYAKPQQKYLAPNRLENFNYEFKADLVLAHAVVWHFPNEKYFQDVIKLWIEKFSPKYIAFNTKQLPSGTFKEAKEYKDDFLNALILNNDHVVKLMKPYKLVSAKNGETKTIPQTYFVFKR